jgi:hypothetical protein
LRLIFPVKKKEFIYYYKHLIPDEETIGPSTCYKKGPDHPHLPPVPEHHPEHASEKIGKHTGETPATAEQKRKQRKITGGEPPQESKVTYMSDNLPFFRLSNL